MRLRGRRRRVVAAVGAVSTAVVLSGLPGGVAGAVPLDGASGATSGALAKGSSAAKVATRARPGR